MRILSIDWDYFIKCSDDFRAVHFPDGGNENIGYALSNMIWIGRYSADDEILKVKSDDLLLDKIKSIINDSKDIFAYAVAESHKHLGEFLLDESIKSKIKSLEIVNIDHHHDFYNFSQEVDCGSWGNRVADAYPEAKFTWIGNAGEVSAESIPEQYRDRITITDDLSQCTGVFDIIYLCRSGVWSPPHLDKNFSALNRFIAKRALSVIFRQELPGRYDIDMQKDIKTSRLQREQFEESIDIAVTDEIKSIMFGGTDDNS